MKDLLDMQTDALNTTDNDACLENLPLAYAYIPYQSFETPYDKEQALQYGTVFSKLNKPYEVYGKEFNRRAGAKRI